MNISLSFFTLYLFCFALGFHYLCPKGEDRMRLGNFEQAQLRSTLIIFALKAKIGCVSAILSKLNCARLSLSLSQ